MAQYYFAALCFIWAAVALGSRVLIIKLGDAWNRWELNSAYPEDKPKWPILVGVFALLSVLLTWAMVWRTDVRHSWIAAAIFTVTLVKPSLVLFRYKQFRQSVAGILNDKRKLTLVNAAVFLLALVLVVLGCYYVTLSRTGG